MSLDPDAQQVADALAGLPPGPPHTLGVEGGRPFLASFDRTIDGRAGPIPIRVYCPGPEPACRLSTTVA